MRLMLNRDEVNQKADRVTDRLEETEQELLATVVQQAKPDDDVTPENVREWQVRKQGEASRLQRKNARAAAIGLKKAGRELGLVIDEVISETAKRQDELVAEIMPGVMVEVPDFTPALMALSQVQRSEALGTLTLIVNTMLHQSQQIYADILAQIVQMVIDRKLTPQQALVEVAAQWAERGIPAMIDRAGRRWSVEAYVNMFVRTTVKSVATATQFARMDDYGLDLIEVSSHAGARPLCAPYQGRIYSRSGNHPVYPPFSSTSYGEPAGLLGINCGHQIYPYVEGVSRRRFQPYAEAENDRIYRESQQQRYLERQIRKAKRELAVMKAIGDEGGIRKATEKVRARQAVMREFIAQTGRTRRYDRERVVLP